MMENVFQEEVGQMIRDMRANYCEEIRRVEFQLEKSEAECDKLTDAMDRQGFPRFKGQSREQFIEQVGVESGTGSNTVNILCALNTVRGRIYNLAFISPTTLRESALKIIDEVKAETELTFR